MDDTGPQGKKASEAQDRLYMYFNDFSCMYMCSFVLSFEACQRLLLVWSGLF